MNDLNPEFVERYQLILENDPESKVFAPLAEAYRKMGLLKEALQICSQGVQFHPEFSGGRVAFARVLIDQGDLDTAVEHLRKAVELESENILAQLLLGDCLLNLKKSKEALKAYKMVLFLNPAHERALKTVKKLESLTADEYEEDVFKMRSLKEGEAAFPLSPLQSVGPATLKNLDRYVSLADAFFIRNDLEQAQKVLLDAQQNLGQHPEIVKRLKLLSFRTHDVEGDGRSPAGAIDMVPLPPLSWREQIIERKLAHLQILLQRVRERTPTLT